MNHLLRSHAPISDSAWGVLDEEARERLTPALAARKLVDFSGPHGWSHSAATQPTWCWSVEMWDGISVKAKIFSGNEDA